MKYIFSVMLVITGITLTAAPPKKKVVKHVIQLDDNVSHKVVTVKPKPKPVKTNDGDLPPYPNYPAQKPEYDKIKFGLLGGLSTPVGDLYSKENCGTDKRLGFHLGGFADFNLTKHHQIRPFISYTKLPGSTWNHHYGYLHHGHVVGVTKSYTNTYSISQLGGDWVYNFTNPKAGWYSVLGLNYTHLKDKLEYSKSLNDHIIYEDTKTNSQDSLALKGGVGYNFNSLLSLEGTYNHASVSSNTFGINNANWIQTSLVVHL